MAAKHAASPGKKSAPAGKSPTASEVGENRSNAHLDQQLEWIKGALREIGAFCRRTSGNAPVESEGPPQPSAGELLPYPFTVHSAPSVAVTDAAGAANAATATSSLQQFLDSVQDITPQQCQVVVDAAIVVIGSVFVHLPLKRAMYGIDPLQRLRLLKQRLMMKPKQGQVLSVRAFHDEMIEIIHSLHDLHTSYNLPAVYRDKIAFLPFMVEEYFDGANLQRHYVVSRLQPGFSHPTFKVGVSVTHWNFIPINRAVELNAARGAGSNIDARHGRGLESLTLRPMQFTAPPDESSVIIGYQADNQPLELRFEWNVIAPTPAPGGCGFVDPTTLATPAAMTMGVDAASVALGRAKKSLFFPEEMAVEKRMARIMAAASAGAASGGKSAEFAAGQVPSRAGSAAMLPISEFQPAQEQLQRAVSMAEAAMPLLSDDLNTTSLLPNHFAFRKVSTPAGEFGYIRIFTFLFDDANQFVLEFVRIAGLLPQEGLIIDVRGNGGGNINAGEQLLQVLTSRQIEPERFHFINSEATLKLSRSDPTLRFWEASLDMALHTGETYSQGFPLTAPRSANGIGRRYPGKVVLVIDALCYSTTDIFAAGFQDHQVSKILGASSRTGAGANVWTYGLLSQLIDLVPLPAGITFNMAIRRSTRVHAKDGVPLEDFGVEAEVRHFMTKKDVLGNNEDLINAAAALLR